MWVLIFLLFFKKTKATEKKKPEQGYCTANLTTKTNFSAYRKAQETAESFTLTCGSSQG